MENMYLTRKAIRKLPGKVMKTVPIPEPTIIEGFGCRGQIGGICKEQSFDTVLILTDKILTNLGYLESIEKSLSDEGIRYEIYDEINSEPKLEYIEAGRSMALKNEAKCIISLGGGIRDGYRQDDCRRVPSEVYAC